MRRDRRRKEIVHYFARRSVRDRNTGVLETARPGTRDSIPRPIQSSDFEAELEARWIQPWYKGLGFTRPRDQGLTSYRLLGGVGGRTCSNLRAPLPARSLVRLWITLRRAGPDLAQRSPSVSPVSRTPAGHEDPCAPPRPAPTCGLARPRRPNSSSDFSSESADTALACELQSSPSAGFGEHQEMRRLVRRTRTRGSHAAPGSPITSTLSRRATSRTPCSRRWTRSI